MPPQWTLTLESGRQPGAGRLVPTAPAWQLPGKATYQPRWARGRLPSPLVLPPAPLKCPPAAPGPCGLMLQTSSLQHPGGLLTCASAVGAVGTTWSPGLYWKKGPFGRSSAPAGRQPGSGRVGSLTDLHALQHHVRVGGAGRILIPASGTRPPPGSELGCRQSSPRWSQLSSGRMSLPPEEVSLSGDLAPRLGVRLGDF